VLDRQFGLFAMAALRKICHDDAIDGTRRSPSGSGSF
jgi:hypothetical protein